MLGLGPSGLTPVWVRVPPAARKQRGPPGRAPPSQASAQQLPDHRHQRPKRLAAVADRVLLLRAQLRAGARLAVRLEDRVVAEAVGALGGVAQDAAELALDHALGAVRQGER